MTLNCIWYHCMVNLILNYELRPNMNMQNMTRSILSMMWNWDTGIKFITHNSYFNIEINSKQGWIETFMLNTASFA